MVKALKGSLADPKFKQARPQPVRPVGPGGPSTPGRPPMRPPGAPLGSFDDLLRRTNTAAPGFQWGRTIFRRVLGPVGAVFIADPLGNGELDLSNPKYQVMFYDPPSMRAAGWYEVVTPAGSTWFERDGPAARAYEQGLTSPRPDIAPFTNMTSGEVPFTVESDTWAAIADMWGRAAQSFRDLQARINAELVSNRITNALAAYNSAIQQGNPEGLAV